MKVLIGLVGGAAAATASLQIWQGGLEWLELVQIPPGYTLAGPDVIVLTVNVALHLLVITL